MKTTVEIPDDLFRKAKAAAASEGIALKEFFAEAVRMQLRRNKPPAAEKPWMRAFGALRHLHRENKRIERIIAREFEKVDEDQWR